MADEVLVPYGEKPSETATLLLGAADELDLEPFVVHNQPEDGGFRVPEEVAKKAKLKGADSDDAEAVAEQAQKQAEADQAAADKAREEQAKATQSPQSDDKPKTTRKRAAKKSTK